MHQALAGNLFVTQLFATLLSLLLRYAIGLHPHSGQSTPPMFGDYEAQRHWMELTLALPMSDWYQNTTENDLQYWGLDYPPLTAFHSLACGLVGSYIVPDSFALHPSRGHESIAGKIFMRSTVLVADILIYIPSCFAVVFALTRIHASASSTLATGTITRQMALLLFLLLQPSLLVIDHGHFQYNGISMGLTLLAVAFLSHDRYYLGAILFSLALNYKQMLLYYSPVFFFYLLAVLLRGLSVFKGLLKVLGVGLLVIGTFAVLWSPWLLQGKASTLQLLHRLFPFERGLFEDKVANFWCTLSLVYKAHLQHTRQELQAASTALTALAFLPCSLHLLLRPSMTSFVYSMVITSLAFFQFSFQVHEKTILFCVVPASLLLAILTGKTPSFTWRHQVLFTVVGMFNIVSLFSMYPLLIKDKLVEVYIALMVPLVTLYCVILSKVISHSLLMLSVLSLLGMGVVHLISALVQPPERYPDIITMMFTTYSYLHFLIFYIIFNVLQWTEETKLGKVE